MRVLITGATGFVGTHLIADLLADGVELVALHRRSNASQLATRPGLTWKRCDLTSAIAPSLLCGIDAVIHLAAAYAPGDDPEVCDALSPLNVDSTDRLASAASAARVRRFILASSIAACEEGTGAIVREETGSPVTAYGRSKLEAEQALRRRAGQMECTILRATALFGEHHRGSVFELARAIAGGRFLIFGSGANRVNFQYVKDYCDTLRGACAGAFAPDVYIAADRAVPLNEFARMIAASLGTSLHERHVPVSVGLAAGVCFDALHRISCRPMPLSTRRVRAMLRDVDYSCRKLNGVRNQPLRYGLARGLDRTVAWYRGERLL
jgi:nucleoside-diphosphate-sugar epimerase